MTGRALLVIDYPAPGPRSPALNARAPVDTVVKIKFDTRERVLRRGDCVSFDSEAAGFERVVLQRCTQRWMKRRTRLIEQKIFALHDFYPSAVKRTLQSQRTAETPQVNPSAWPTVELCNGDVSLRVLYISLVDVAAAADQRRTVLHRAVESDDLALVRLLVSKSEVLAKLLPLRDDLGMTALDLACRLDRNDIALEFLVHFYSVPARNTILQCAGQPSILHHAIAGGSVSLACLVANCFFHETDTATGACLKDAVDAAGQSPLHMAALHNLPDVVSALLDVEADCGLRNNDGDTALMVALRACNPLVAAALLTPRGDTNEPACRADVCNLAQETPLILLAPHGDPLIASLLLKAGAVPGHTLPNGVSCLHIAAENGHAEFCRVILAWHAFRLAQITLSDLRGSAIAASVFLPQYRTQGRTAADIARANGFVELASELQAAEAKCGRASLASSASRLAPSGDSA